MITPVYQVEVNTGYTSYTTALEYDKAAEPYRGVGIGIRDWDSEAAEGKEDYSQYLRLVESTHIAQASDLVLYCELGFNFQVKQKLEVNIDPSKVFEEIAQKQEVSLKGPEVGNTYNSKVDVHMPGNMLGSYNQVMLLEDACSDALQTQISSGWRIIAACPQSDQRRPDYILGRYNENYEIEDSAARGK